VAILTLLSSTKLPTPLARAPKAEVPDVINVISPAVASMVPLLRAYKVVPVSPFVVVVYVPESIVLKTPLAHVY
jgi:hypothetical protein